MKARAVAVVLFLSLVVTNVQMAAWHATLFDTQAHARNATEAVLSVLGELRSFMARMLWFKSDVYHHVIERQLGSSEGSKDLIAIHRMIATLDPHFWQAYDVGSWDLFKAGNKDGTLSFISEGIANNPEERMLWWDKGYFCFRYKLYPEGADCSVRSYVLSKTQLDAVNSLRIMCLNFQGEGDLYDEYQSFEKWLSIWPNDITARARLDALKAKGADKR